MKSKDLMKIRDVKCSVDYVKVLKKNGKRTVKTLESLSPHSDRANRATPYKLGWVADFTKMRTGDRVTVWNKTNWQLTHLLENGHFITNSRGGIKWSRPIPHIRETYNAMRPKFIHDMKRVEIDFKII